jgi:hypothetical protein
LTGWELWAADTDATAGTGAGTEELVCDKEIGCQYLVTCFYDKKIEGK